MIENTHQYQITKERYDHFVAERERIGEVTPKSPTLTQAYIEALDSMIEELLEELTEWENKTKLWGELGG